MALKRQSCCALLEDAVKEVSFSCGLVVAAMLLAPSGALGQGIPDEGAVGARPASWSVQQSNLPADVRQAEDDVERAVRRYRVGVHGGIGLDPELIMFAAHGAFGPIFRRGVDFRPGIELGVGELTTTLGINLEVLYTLPGPRRGGLIPYVGAGPNFGLSHRGLDSDELEEEDDAPNRFDFSDTDFEGGVNFIAGARSRNGMFLEMKATVYGVSNVRLLVGFNF